MAHRNVGSLIRVVKLAKTKNLLREPVGTRREPARVLLDSSVFLQHHNQRCKNEKINGFCLKEKSRLLSLLGFWNGRFPLILLALPLRYRNTVVSHLAPLNGG